MNCSKGDIAIIVGATYPALAGCIGHICRCVEQVNHPISGEPGWVIDPPVQMELGEFQNCLDKVMRPLRDPGDDAFDEMLLIAGLPQEVAA